MPFKWLVQQGLKLELHPVKRKIFSSRAGVDFLGYFIRPYYKIVRFGNIRRFMKKVDRYKQRGLWEDKKENVFASWSGYAKQADSYKLIKTLFA